MIDGQLPKLSYNIHVNVSAHVLACSKSNALDPAGDHFICDHLTRHDDQPLVWQLSVTLTEVYRSVEIGLELLNHV